MTTLLNFTPHPIHIVDADGLSLATVEPSGLPARVDEEIRDAGGLLLGETSVPLFAVASRGATSGLPDPADGTRIVVSRMVFDANPERTDLLAPYVLARDAHGAVIGCSAFLCR